MVSSLHKRNLNVLKVDFRDGNNIDDDSLKTIISDYAKNYSIRFFIINAHGFGD